MKTIYFQTGVLLLLISGVGCAGNTVKDAALTETKGHPSANYPSPETAGRESVSIEAKLAGAAQNTSEVTEVKFEKESRTLSEVYQKKIDAALAVAEKKAPLLQVTVAAWSDSEMPRHHEPELSKEQQKLATDRAEVVKAYIQQKHAKLSTTLVNMAARPSKISNFLRTQAVRIQQAMEGAGPGDPKASHAVVIIETRLNH